MKRLVIKIGSSSLVKKNGQINEKNITTLTKEIKKLKDMGVEVALVTSGAIAVGFPKLGLSKKPTQMAKKQACAAIGQPALMSEYEKYFTKENIVCSQILVTHDDFGSRKRMNHLTETVDALFRFGAVPIINENDALTDDEIKVGDNDTLSAMTALTIGADLLVLVTDVDGLFDSNPSVNKDAKLIKVVDEINGEILKKASGTSSSVGTGGMSTKLKAGLIVTNSGIDMQIINQRRIEDLSKVYETNLGTTFKKQPNKRPIRQSWLIYCASVEGQIYVDNGAIDALLRRKSLLSCGVKKVEGSFDKGVVINVCNQEGKVFAKGITSFSDNEINEIISSGDSHIIVHANNVAVLEE